jgi:hypothetical protein
MYAFIWRHLPGPVSIKILISLALIGLVALLLNFVVFPWLDNLLTSSDVIA